jgi:integrase/recombinase XerD
MINDKFGRPNEIEKVYKSLDEEQRFGIDDFIKENEINRYSKRTIEQYRFYLIHLHNITKKSYLTMCNEDIRGFVHKITTSGLTNTPITASSQKMIYSLINSFFNYHKKPELRISREKIKGKINAEREIFSLEERDKFFETAERLFGVGIRALFEFSYWQALRVNEAIEMKVDNIDFERNRLHIIAGKGDKDAIIELLPKAREIIDRYMKSEYFTPKQKYLFEYDYKRGRLAGKRGRYYIVLVEGLFQRVLKEMNMTKFLTFHCLRHSCGSHLLHAMGESGLPYVRKHLRHAFGSPVTLRYLHVLDKDINKEQLDKIGG